MTADLNTGILTLESKYTVEESLDKLQAALQSKGIKVFAVIDHSGEAEKAGLQMPPTKVLIFGSPKGGTPLMLASPSLALDLPLKVLIAQDAAGRVWLSYNSPEYLQHRHNVAAELIKNIAVVGPLLQSVLQVSQVS